MFAIAGPLVLALAVTDWASAAPWRALPTALTSRLRLTKQLMSPFRKSGQFSAGAKGPEIVTAAGRRYKLLPVDGEDRRAVERSASTGSNTIPFTSIPKVVDRRSVQTPVKDQGNRSTCVAHACCALLEVFPEIPDDLSEQDMHWMFMQQLRRRGLGRLFEFPHPTVRDDEGINCGTAGGYLNDHLVCAESYSPYVDDENDLTDEHERRSETAEQHAWFGIAERERLSGDDLADLARLVPVLATGHDIVFSVDVAWDATHVRVSGGVVDVVLDDDGDPAEPGGGHAMVMVGYDMPNRRVIVKNSWGEDWGDKGYCHMTLDYLEVYGRRGFWVKKVRVHDDAEPAVAAMAVAVASATARNVGSGLVRGVTLGLLGQ